VDTLKPQHLHPHWNVNHVQRFDTKTVREMVERGELPALPATSSDYTAETMQQHLNGLGGGDHAPAHATGTATDIQRPAGATASDISARAVADQAYDGVEDDISEEEPDDLEDADEADTEDHRDR